MGRDSEAGFEGKVMAGPDTTAESQQQQTTANK